VSPTSEADETHAIFTCYADVFSSQDCVQRKSVYSRSTWQCAEHFIPRCQEALVEVEVEVDLRPTVSRPVCVGVGHPFGTRDQFFFLLEIFFRQYRFCHFVAPSLTRGLVCNLLLLAVLASAVPLGSESRGTQDHILLSQFLRLPKPGEPDPRIYIPQEQGGLAIPPGTEFPFCRLLRLAR
jgi:hypothetical protein